MKSFLAREWPPMLVILCISCILMLIVLSAQTAQTPLSHGTVDQFIVPSIDINGTQTAFWMTSAPLYNSSVYVWVNGLLQAQGIDYNVKPGNAIVFNPKSTPQVGDIVVCSYKF